MSAEGSVVHRAQVIGLFDLFSLCSGNKSRAEPRKAEKWINYCLQTHNLFNSVIEILLGFEEGGQGKTVEVCPRCRLPWYASGQQGNSH